MFIELIELIFLVLKAFFLAALYTALCIGVLFISGSLLHLKRLKGIIALKYFGAPVFLIVFISLFIYHFSYTEDRGIGEYARVPVGLGYFIENCDGQSSYIVGDEFDANKVGQLDFDKFYKRGSVIYAKTVQVNSADPLPFYFSYDMRNGRYTRIGTDKEYDHLANSAKFPNATNFYNFGHYYHSYWSKRAKWKSWLLL